MSLEFSQNGWNLNSDDDMDATIGGMEGIRVFGQARCDVVAADRAVVVGGGGGGGGGSKCTRGYSPCLPPASDFDCAGGDDNWPAYTRPGLGTTSRVQTRTGSTRTTTG